MFHSQKVKTFPPLLYIKASIIFMLFALCLTIHPVSTKAATKYTVTFLHYNGQTNATYNAMKKTVSAGTKIQFPAIPTVKNYQKIGWSTTKQSSTAQYKAGATITVNRNLVLYSAYKRYPYLIAFASNSGQKNATYNALAQWYPLNAVVTLPAVPNVLGYAALGWSSVPNATTANYSAGQKIKVTRHATFYAVYKKKADCTINFFKQNGTYDTETLSYNRTVAYNTAITLPSLKNPNGYTFMGWSTSHAQSLNPTYYPGQTIRVTRNTTLYAVMYKRTSEKYIGKTNMIQLNTNKYSRIIFVGDSRTWLYSNILANEFGRNYMKGCTYIANPGKGLNWFKSTGVYELTSNLKTYGYGTATKPIAIVFNLGVNDLDNCDSYITYMKALAPKLKPFNVKLFYCSVNPANTTVYHTYIDESKIIRFNSKIYAQLSSYYKYINSYSYLMKNGFVYDRGAGNPDYNYKDNYFDDGLHYSSNTSKKIFNYVMTHVNAS